MAHYTDERGAYDFLTFAAQAAGATTAPVEYPFAAVVAAKFTLDSARLDTLPYRGPARWRR